MVGRPALLRRSGAPRGLGRSIWVLYQVTSHQQNRSARRWPMTALATADWEVALVIGAAFPRGLVSEHASPGRAGQDHVVRLVLFTASVLAYRRAARPSYRHQP